LTGVLAEAWGLYRRFAAHFLAIAFVLCFLAAVTYVLAFLIWVAFDIALGLALLAVPAALRSFLSSVIGGTLLAPCYALVVTLVYYRLSEAHAGAVPAAPPRGGFTAPPPARA
jgi:hypothetical protein